MKQGIFSLILILFTFSIPLYGLAQERWVAPPGASSMKSPFDLKDEKVIRKGEKIFGKVCWTCHGEEGKGDGPASVEINPKPANLTSPIIQDQPDGAFYWKISKGRGLMASYHDALSDNQRWQLVAFIRSLAQDPQE